MTDIRLNDFLYFVDDDLNVSALEILELIRAHICKEDTYLLLKLEDGREVKAFTDGKIEECDDFTHFRYYYTSYKEAVKMTLKSINEDIEHYNETLRKLMDKKKRLEEED